MLPSARQTVRLVRSSAALALAPALGLLAVTPLGRQGRTAGPASQVRASLRYSTTEGIFAELFGACVGATALTGWALHLGASAAEVALVAALPQLAQLAQVPAAWVTSALGRRFVTVWAVSASRLVLFPLVLLPFLPLSSGAARALLVAVAAAAAVLGVLGNNGWNAWMGELVPARLRGRYFGRRTAVITLCGTLAGLASAELLDGAAGPEATGLALSGLALVACVFGVVSGVLLARQHDPVTPPEPVPGLAAALRPVRDPVARRLLVYQLAWNAAVGLGGGLFTFFLLGSLRAGFTVVALHAALGAVTRLVAAPLWGRLVDRLGARPVLAACSFALAALPLLWLTLAPDRLWPVALDAVLGGVAWGGHGIAAFAAPLAVAPRRDRPFYLAAFALTGGVAFALAAALGGLAVTALPAPLATLGRAGGHGLEAVFLASAALRLASAFLALRIPERGAGTLLELHQAARGAALGVLAGARARAFGPRRAA